MQCGQIFQQLNDSAVVTPSGVTVHAVLFMALAA
jgi:hypothetical protein